MGAKSVIALYREGQAICSQGDAGKQVFYIKKGQVKITVKSKGVRRRSSRFSIVQTTWVRDA